MSGVVDERPNILFILTDDWGWGDLACYGHPSIRTPHLDRLAAQGTLYTQFYAAAPVCSPTRASFLTGRFPGEIGFHHICETRAPWVEDDRGVPDFLDPELPTVARMLQEAGYRTAHYGKWHLGDAEDAPDLGRYGFDRHRSTNSRHDDLRSEYFGDVGITVARPEDDVEFRRSSSRLIVDRVIEFLDEGGEDPFFVQTWLLDPHATLFPTDDALEAFRDFSPVGIDNPGANAIYYAVIAEADRQIGRLLDALDERGLSENTIVVFTSDNGPEDQWVRNAAHSAAGSPGPFRGRKRSLYEGGIRVPLIVRWPGRTPAGAVDDDSLLSSVDFVATCAELGGAVAPETRGASMVPALTGRPQSPQRPLFWEFRFDNRSHPLHRSPMRVVRSGRWKLLANPDASRVELYDIPNDPMELDNRADREPEIVARLSRLVETWADALPEGPCSPDAGSNAYPWPRAGEAVGAVADGSSLTTEQERL